MRGVLPDLPSPVPLLHRLPGVLQEDDFLQRFLGAFDSGFAPVVATLDSLHAYVDPHLAPADFLDWLSGWVGVVDVRRVESLLRSVKPAHVRHDFEVVGRTVSGGGA